jgi:ATP-dependent exoDNAse (exonuclease V) beta subunit
MDGYEPVDLGLGGSGPETEGVEAKNPAWQEFVGDVPDEVYKKYIEPAYTKWDQSVNQRFNKVQQEYEPWKDVVKNADPQTASFALNLLNALNNNPADVVQKVSEYYKLDQIQDRGQGQGPETKVVPEAEPWVKEVEALKQHNALLTEAMLQRHQAEEDKKADDWLDSELSRLKETNKVRGDFNETWVCSMAAQTGVSLDDAVKSYYEWRDQEVNKYRSRPLIMPGGGGAPGAGGLNVRKMDDKQTNGLIVDLLNAHNAQRNQ